MDPELMSRDMTNTATETILVRLTGPDHPGITAALMDILGSAGAGLEDVEQVIIRGRLSLSLIINVPTGRDLVKELLLFAWEQKMEIDFDVIREVSSAPRPDLVVTMVGAVIHPLEFGAIASVIAAAGSNIDRIVRLAKEPVMAYELVLSGGDPDAVRRNLLATAKDLHCDVAVQTEGIGRRASRLVVMDVDSTLIRKEMIDLIAERAGTAAEVAEITEQAMRGELDFEQSLRDRVLLLKGLPATVLEEVAAEIRLTPWSPHVCAHPEGTGVPHGHRVGRLHRHRKSSGPAVGDRPRRGQHIGDPQWPAHRSADRTDHRSGRKSCGSSKVGGVGKCSP